MSKNADSDPKVQAYYLIRLVDCGTESVAAKFATALCYPYVYNTEQLDYLNERFSLVKAIIHSKDETPLQPRWEFDDGSAFRVLALH